VLSTSCSEMCECHLKNFERLVCQTDTPEQAPRLSLINPLRRTKHIFVCTCTNVVFARQQHKFVPAAVPPMCTEPGSRFRSRCVWLWCALWRRTGSFFFFFFLVSKNSEERKTEMNARPKLEEVIISSLVVH